MMNKLFDLQFVIGLFFLVVGLLLLSYRLISSAAIISKNEINLYCGGLFSVFGFLMLIFSGRKKTNCQER